MPEEPSAEAAALPLLPRWVPPWLLDGTVVGVVALLTAGVVAGQVLLHGPAGHTVLGDAINVAQRLQSQALAGEALASAATLRLAPPHNAEPAGTRRLKGRDQLVEAYRIVWAASPTGKDDVPAASEGPVGVA